MKREVFTEVMVPLISVRRSALIMISTLVDKFNFYTRLLNLVDPATGRKVVNSYVCELVCETCKMGQHPEKCKHMAHLLPWWKNAGGNTLQSLLYADDKHLMAREALGVIIDGGLSWFDRGSIDFLANVTEVAVSPILPVHWVIVACDPNAGGEGGMAFTAMTVYRGYHLIVGMATYSPKGSRDRASYAATFFTELRQNEALRNAWIIFVCERNTGYEAGSLNEVLQAVDPKNVAVRERADRDYGWWSTKNIKMAYGTTSRKALGMKSVRFMRGWVACSSYGDSKLKSPDAVRAATKEEFIIELGNVRVVNKLTTNPASNDQASISGKVGEDGKVRRDQNDDLFITFGMALFIMELYVKDRLPNFDHRRVRASYGAQIVAER